MSKHTDRFWNNLQTIFYKSDIDNPECFLKQQGIRISNKTRKLIIKW